MSDDPRKHVSVTLDIEQWQYDFAVKQAAELTDIPTVSPNDPLEITGTEKRPNWNSAEDYLSFVMLGALTNEIPEDQWPEEFNPKPKGDPGGIDPDIPL